jgi:DeoD family purine-nucleoside phosphorylase
MIHLHPTAPLADRVLLPGDPGRALLLAQSLLEAPKMFNHNRGLWGYTGTAPDGEPVTVQSTGMGGPSAAIVISELADLGVTRMIRVGTCGALHPGLALGDLLAAREAIAADGTSRALGAGERVLASPELMERMPDLQVATVVSTDLFYDDRREPEREWIAAGAQAVEMEAAALYALAGKRGFQAAAILIVSDLLRAPRSRIDPEALKAAARRMGEAALRALAP